MQKIKRKFLQDELSYHSMIEKLQNEPRIHLTTGNCGIFAVALMNLTRCGNVIVLDEDDNYSEEIPGYGHCMLEAFKKYFDGENIYYSESEIEEWHNFTLHKRYLFDDTENKKNAIKKMIRNTNTYHSIYKMEKIILKYIPAKYKLKPKKSGKKEKNRKEATKCGLC